MAAKSRSLWVVADPLALVAAGELSGSGIDAPDLRRAGKNPRLVVVSAYDGIIVLQPAPSM
jgi:hypothetical protein